MDGAGTRTRTGMIFRSADFESAVATSFTMPARFTLVLKVNASFDKYNMTNTPTQEQVESSRTWTQLYEKLGIHLRNTRSQKLVQDYVREHTARSIIAWHALGYQLAISRDKRITKAAIWISRGNRSSSI